MSRYWVEHRGGTWTDIDLTANHFQLQAKAEQDALRRKAMSGDMTFAAVPATLGNDFNDIHDAITADDNDKFYRTVKFELRTAAGEIHTWFNGGKTISIGHVTAGDGAAAIAGGGTTATFVDGVATVVVEYTGTWAAADTATLTLAENDVLGYTLSERTSVDTIVGE